PLACQGCYHLTRCRQPQAERSCGVRHSGIRMTAYKDEHACLEWGYSDRLQTSSELAVHLQHQFQQRQFLIAVVLDTLHGQCVAAFATRCPISIIPPNRSSTFSDWYEVRPFLFSISRISSMILLTVLVSKYGSGKAVSAVRARGRRAESWWRKSK